MWDVTLADRLAPVLHSDRVVSLPKRCISPAATVIRGGDATRLPAEPGIVDDVNELVEIRSGIATGERVVLGPAREVSSGTPVRVTERSEIACPAEARVQAPLSADRAGRSSASVPST